MSLSKPDAPPPQAAGTCPICGAPTEAQYRPFCSKRCADVDLSRWLRGAYAISGEADGDDEDGESTDTPSPASDVEKDVGERKRR
jgi:hypothetical protein